MNNTKKNTILKALIILGTFSLSLSLYFQYIKPIIDILYEKKYDSTRIKDIKLMDALILDSKIITSSSTPLSNVVYISIPSNKEDCSDIELPSLNSGWVYHCATEVNYRNTNGTGWIPLNLLDQKNSLNLLKIDPINNNNFYYLFIPSFIEKDKLHYTLAAVMNTKEYLLKNAQSDNGLDNKRYEAGNQPSLLGEAEGLTTYFPFDDDSTNDVILNKIVTHPNVDLPIEDLYQATDCLSKLCIRNKRNGNIRINFSPFAKELNSNVFTYGFWFNTSFAPKQNIQLFNPGANRIDVNIEANSGALFIWYYNNEDKGSLIYKSSSQEFIDGRWHQLYLVKDQNSIIVYIDGQRIQKFKTQSHISGIIDQGSINLMPDMSLDEMRIYSRALSNEEINSDYETLKK